MHSIEHAEAQYHYDNELFKYLKNNNRTYHNMPFVSFLKADSFVKQVNKLFEYFGFEFLDNKILKDIHAAWLKENHRQFKKNLSLKEEEKFRWRDT